MKRFWYLFYVAWIVIPGFVLNGVFADSVDIPGDPEILPVQEIRSGMMGYGVSRFQDNQMERMSVEILGVIENGTPESSMILGRVTGNAVDRGGIMSGMSGSPVYINGKLAGAMAYSFPFARESICGITPMTAMDKLWKPVEVASKVLNRVLRHPGQLFKAPGDAFRNVMAPIDIPMVCTGMAPDMVNQLRNWSTDGGLMPVSGGIVGETAVSPVDFQPGDAVGVLFADGDIRMAGMGTVTAVEGNRLLAFGHPLFNLGRCELPMIAGEVVSFIPSLAQSFKLINSGRLAGTVVNDGDPGIAGIIGTAPPLTLIRFSLRNSQGIDSEYQFRVIRHPDYTPAFAAMGLAGIMSNTTPPAGDRTYRFTVKARLDNGHELEYRYMTGSAGLTYEDCYTAISRITSVLSNPFETISVTKMDVTCEVTTELEIAALESVRVISPGITPGSKLALVLNLKGYRSGAHSRRITLEVPESVQPGKYVVEVLDAEDYRKWQSSRTLPDHEYNTFEEYLDNLSHQTVNDEFHVMLRALSKDVVTGGAVLRNSPPTLQSLMSLPESGAEIRAGTKVLSDKTVQFPFQVIGSQRLNVVVYSGVPGR